MSNINPNIIDGTFPIAGQDNSSQGFRDNFTNIRNNFSYAQSEISDLQAKAITTTALAGSSINNDMGYNVIKNPQLFSPSYTYLNLGTPTAGTTVTLDYSLGNYQKFTTNGNYTLAFSNWPAAGQFGSMTAWINVTSTSHIITVPIVSPGVTIGISDIAGSNASTGQIYFDQPGQYFLQFNTVDSGVNISIIDLSRNFSTIRDPNFYWDDNVVSTLLVGYGQNQTSFQTVFSLEAGQDAISAHGSYNSVCVANLTLANVQYQQVNVGQIGGYSVSGAQGNLQTGSIQPVKPNDLIGYRNAVVFTGNGSSNTFSQISTILHYATGSNVAGGLGGNLAFFTAKDGDGSLSPNRSMYQAVGIENDQSVKIYGNIVMAGAKIDSGYQYYAPSANFGNYPVYANVSRFVMDPTTTITNGNIRLPATMPDGTVIKVSSTQTITNFSFWAGRTTTIVPSANVTLTGGTAIEFFYKANETKWYKVA